MIQYLYCSIKNAITIILQNNRYFIVNISLEKGQFYGRWKKFIFRKDCIVYIQIKIYKATFSKMNKINKKTEEIIQETFAISMYESRPVYTTQKALFSG